MLFVNAMATSLEIDFQKTAGRVTDGVPSFFLLPRAVPRHLSGEPGDTGPPAPA
jgi:hypothetical protein